MQDETFIAAFQAGTLEPFHHQDHVRMAWLYLQRAPVLDAIANFTADLQRYAAAHGQPNLYHETITWGYLLLMHERMARVPGLDWEAFAAAHPDLLTWEQSVLKKYYCAETLASDLARRVFVFPDNCAQSLA
jgi:hypothetical protein